MLLYLLNATLIWGFSLLAYELLFRNETVHHWNRVYLLLTLCLGLVLPLWTLQPDASLQDNNPVAFLSTVPVQRLAAVKADVVQLAAPKRASFVFSWWLVYGAGVVWALLRLVRDVARIVSLYRVGSRTQQPGWTLVETGRPHSPFSFFRWVFLSAADPSTPAEQALILRHERRHGSLLHSVDMLLLQLVQVALWFHPLVYWYQRRLELVHEYQADAAAGADVQAYGRLLLAQATDKPLPPIVHSFHRSPLKTRIAMLMKHPSGAARRLRYVVAVPFVIASAFICSCRVTQEPDKKIEGNKVFYKGNEFKLSEPITDSIEIVGDDHVKMDAMVVTTEPQPETMNGEKIYTTGSESGIAPARYIGKDRSATEQFFGAIQRQLNRLPDGRYEVTIFSPVISKDGELVYFDTRGVEYPGMPMEIPMTEASQKRLDSMRQSRTPINPSLKKEIDAAIQTALRQPFRFKPALRNGVEVASYLEGDLNLSGSQQIQVKDGAARIVLAQY